MNNCSNNALTLMSWNVNRGGFSSYDPNSEVPAREGNIKTVIRDAHNNRGVGAAALIDAYRWDEIYGGDAGIASHLEYRDARFMRLNDERLNRDNGAGIGIAFASDISIEQSRALDLETRQGLGIILAIGAYGLQIASVYLDDLSEEVRIRQMKALVADLEPDVPTVLVGDFNMLRAELTGASLVDRTKDFAVRSLARIIPQKELRVPVMEMNKRKAVPLVESLGFRDADCKKKRPTAPSVLPVFGVDYAFCNNSVQVRSVDIIRTKKASDHSAIVVDLKV